MKYDLQGKIIMITGANSGIGKAASIQLAQCGAAVIMACRSEGHVIMDVAYRLCPEFEIY